MDGRRFRQFVEAARGQAPAPDDGEEAARRAASRPAAYQAEEIVAARQVPWDPRADPAPPPCGPLPT